MIDENVERFGVNIPASDINLTMNIIGWGDGNNGMSHYLSVLATELWLLKNNGHDYSVTLKELYYAMLAMERLDLYSEQEWRIFNNMQAYYNPDTDINGCHIRDDVSELFWAQYGDHFKVSLYNSVYSDRFREEISQDNIYHNFEGLALVASLVGSESVAAIPVTFVNPHINSYLTSKGIRNGNTINFSEWAKDYVKRYIKFMQRGGKTWRLRIAGVTIASLTNDWVLLNPVTGAPVAEGSGLDFDTGIFFNSGVIQTGSAIAGQNLRTKPPFIISPITSQSVFNALFASGQVPVVKWPFPFDKIFDPIVLDINWLEGDRYKVSSLAMNGNSLYGLTFPTLRLHQYAILDQPYEHFTLLYETLRDPARSFLLPFTGTYEEDRLNIETLLNAAPLNGPTSSGEHLFSSSSRCVWPERLGDSAGEDIEYSGLDYMMLHNLYYIAFHVTNYNSLIFRISGPPAPNFKMEPTSPGTLLVLT